MYTVKYVGEYIILSKSLAEAYYKFLHDKSRMKFPEKLKVKILNIGGIGKPTSTPAARRLEGASAIKGGFHVKL